MSTLPFKYPTAILGFILSAFTISTSAQPQADTEAQATDAIAEMRAARIDQAVPVELWAPLPELRADDSLFLVLNNAFGVELSAAVELIDSAGRPRRLGMFKVPPSRHRRVDVKAALPAAHFGSPRLIRVTYPGDIEMFQAWLIQDGAGGVEETMLRSATATASQSLAIFWDSAWLSGSSAEPSVWIINTSSEPIVLQGRFLGKGPPDFTTLLKPRVGTALDLPKGLGRGTLVLSHLGPPGSILAFATLGETRGRLSLPVASNDAFPAENRYATVRLPVERSFFAVANLEKESRSLVLNLVDPRSGGLLATIDRELSPESIETFDVPVILQRSGRLPTDFVAARLQASPGKILVAAGSTSAIGLPVDAPVFTEEMAHQNGSYPVLDTSRFRTVATLLNIGEEDSWVGGQVLWEGGSYTIGRTRIPAGSVLEIDFSNRRLRDEADRKGRNLPRQLPNGYFQWTVLRGSHSILGRTEAFGEGKEDSVGFNCLGCCEEYSFGRVEPDGASFLPGQTPLLGANEYISTCGATLGPFEPYISLINAPSPFTWDGARVGASQPAINSVYFQGEGERIHPPGCSARLINYGDSAPVQSIRITIEQVSLPLDKIRVTLYPTEASGQLTLKLQSPSVKTVVNNQTYSGGTYNFSFGPLASFSEGQEFTQVYAEWKASTGTSAPTTATTTSSYHFKVLGLYEQTQYNTPVESACGGSLSSFCYQSGGCGGISCNGGATSSGRSVWISEVLENGSGVHSTLGTMSREFYCGQKCGSLDRFRAVPTPCGSCGTTLAAGQSVAINISNFFLSCGDQVFIEGLGTRTVADSGGGLSTRQLDHFAGPSGCNVESSLGNRLTFKLF